MYENRIKGLEESLALAQKDLEDGREHRRSINASLHLVERLNGLIYKARLCNNVVNHVRHQSVICGMDKTYFVKQLLGMDHLLSITQMEAILLFAPQWSTILSPAGELKAASLYQVEFIRKSDGAVFYKVGHTGRPLTTRLSGLKYDKRKYTASVHHQILFKKKHVAAAEEARLHLANTALRYDGEPFLTNGHTEVYVEPLISPKLRLEISLYALLGISRD